MKKLSYITILAASMAFCSCSDFLDVKPVGKLIPTQIDEYEKLLNNTNTLDYFMLDNNRNCSYAFLGDNLQISESQAIGNYTATFPNLDMLAAYIGYYPIYPSNSTPMSWSYGIFRALSYFNNVIDGVSSIDTKSTEAKSVIAQAMVGRAWIYMHAALCYGPMYDPNGANDTKVLPLRTSGDPTQSNGPLATTKQIFEQVKADLDYACENCPVNIGNPSRANLACAYALRAEYDMYVRDWTAMAADAKMAWETALKDKGGVDNMLYNYADFYYEATSVVDPAEGEDEEVYMTLRHKTDTKFERTDNCEDLLYRNTPYNYSTSRFYPSQDWLDLFDETDLRAQKFIFSELGYSKVLSDGTRLDDGIQKFDYRGNNIKQTAALTYPLLLLMKAEAEARTNKLSEALTSLNLLRQYRYQDGAALKGGSSLSQDQLINEILNERRREAPLVSFQRTLDLKRFILDGAKPWVKNTITHYIGSKSYTLNVANDEAYKHLPIDNAILKYNPQWGIEPVTTTFEPYNAW